MSNEAPAHEAVPSSVESIRTTKVWYLSKTFWTNLLILLSVVFPVVQEWAAQNPAAMPVIFAFVNLVLRTATNQGITLSTDGVSKDGGASGGSGGVLPLALFLLTGMWLLPSCSGSGYPLSGSISYRDPDSGAKGGLVFEPGKAPRASVRVPVYDEAGNLIGVGELSGPLAREIPASAK